MGFFLYPLYNLNTVKETDIDSGTRKVSCLTLQWNKLSVWQ
jgi:hypothetical protein